MSSSPPCLDEATAQRLARGELTGTPAERHFEHVADCGDCFKLLAAARRAHAEAVTSDAESQTLPERPRRAGDRPLPVSAPPRPPEVVERLGRYLLLDQLGEGGMGLVRRAYDPQLNRQVAVKLLRSESHDELRELSRQRLLREAQAMARVSHPNIVTVFDAGEFGEQVFLAMELVEGTSLDVWLRPTRTWREILDAFLQAGRGLAAAHAAGLVHRDFKPSNVLVRADGRAQVTDFGIARLEGTHGPTSPAAAAADAFDSGPLTLAGGVLGTPRYMAPEQYEGQAVDARTDQFSFCVALYEALYGQLPFEGRAPADRMAQARAGAVRPPPRSSRAPGWLFPLLQRGLSASPGDRWPTLDALLSCVDRRLVRRGRQLALGAGGAALLSAALAFGAVRVGRPRPCQFGAEELRGAWDPARSAAVGQRFSASTEPGADAVWHATRAQLDRYADAWLAARRDACAATRVNGTQSEQLLELRMICLDRRRATLAALTELLAQGGPALLKANDAVMQLPELADCADALHLTLEGEAETPQARAAAAPLRARLDAATALLLAGRFAEVRAAAEPLVREARALQNPAVLAEALSLAGHASAQLRDMKSARDEMSEALQQALAAHKDGLAAEVAASLLVAVADDPSARALMVPLARGVIDRAGSPPLADSHFWHAQGYAAFLGGRYPEAAADFEKAAEIASRGLGADHPRTLSSLAAQVEALAHTHDGARALELAQRVLAAKQRTLGPQNGAVVNAMSTTANALILNRRYEEARAMLLQAAELARRRFGPGTRTELSMFARLGLVEEGEGHLAEAKRLLMQAVEGETQSGMESPASAEYRVELAQVLLEQGDLDGAAQQAERSFGTTAKADPDSPDLADPLTVRGEVELAHGQLESARADLERALALRARGNAPSLDDARTHFALARALGGGERALQLARDAKGCVPGTPLAEEIDRWLAAH